MSDESNLRTQLEPFNIEDLALDVRLTAIVNSVETDFTGKKIFSVEFFRKGIGFGITDIDIEVNTSLQPVITITFKDLYGNTVFGKTKSTNPDLLEVDSDDVDFSVLFNWPPPKFLFTFKGFLGKSATWMLNMKKTSTSYDTSDGSYNIKCEFVPNQWGFLSDLPFLYLLAVKALKKQTMDEAQFAKVQSIFDLIKIGKQVEIKTQETTKEFDNLMKQMTLLKSQRVYDALNISKVVNYDEAINGQVGNQTITPFNSVTIVGPALVPGNSDIDSPEKIKALATNATNLRRINTFFLLTSKIGNTNPRNITFNDVVASSGANGTVTVPSISNFEQDIAARLTLISDNISQIENAIKLKTYNSSKTQLEKVTIGEIFKQLAEDSGYIMGRILEAGYQGYNDPQFTALRNDPGQNLIGRNFPLIFTKDKREEKPAIQQYGSNVGADEHELAFVDNFINALSEGIATELLSETESTQNVGDNFIKKRINNLEALRQNPYKPFFQNIAENIMVRGAIVAYLTRSFDPNYPGDYDTSLGVDRATDAEDVIALADSEIENITDSIIGSLTDSDFKSLKRFCTFWDNFLTEDCLHLQEPGTGDKKGSLVEGPSLDSSFLSAPGVPLPNTLLDYTVLIQKPANWDGTYAGQSGLETTTLRNIMQDVFRPKPSGSGSIDATNSNFVSLDSLQAKKLINNGIAYFKPINAAAGGIFKKSKYVFVMISGPDADKTQQIMSSTSDAEIKNDSEKQRDTDEPLGFLNIQNPKDKDGNLIKAVAEMNSNRIPKGLLLDYSKLTNPNNEFFQNPNTVTVSGQSYFTVNNKLGDPDNLAAGEILAKNIALSIAYNPDTVELIFGPFVLGLSDSIVHRGWIKRICEKLRAKAESIEQKRNQIISDVLGKSAEQRDLLYKQMHVLYHQWEVLIIKDSYSAAKQNTDANSPGAISGEMNERYSNHVNYNMSESIANEAADNTFLYGYPLNSRAKEAGRTNIEVKNSIINIEPLYKPNGNTTVLNIIQQICTKNNFIFIPMPGEPGAFSTSEIFAAHPTETPKVKNFFYVQFVPTPESRATISNSEKTPLSSSNNIKNNLPEGTLQIKFGSTQNQIVKNISVDTQESKTTAESIVNLQRLVDNENQNKTVTTDCSMLPVMEGRSYKATADMLGNAQIFPMQFFYLDSIPLFNGLYQIMKVKHSIKPNDMTTSAEGIRMRMDYQTGDFGGIPPITLETLSSLSAQTQLATSPSANLTTDDFKRAVADAGVDSQQGQNVKADAAPTSTVTTAGVILLPNIRGVRNSIRLTQSTNPAISPIADTNSEYTKEVIIKNLNQFISDVLEPFSGFLKQNYPDLYKNWYITSAQRGYVPPGGAGGKGNQNISQHQKGQAFDSQIVGGKTVQETMESNLKLLNAILEWHTLNPAIKYDQILWETRSPGSSWIHWSYHRAPEGRTQLLRFVNDSTYKSAKINGFGRLAQVTAEEVVLKIA